MCIDIEMHMRSERNTGGDSMNIINENHNCSGSPTLFKPSHRTIVSFDVLICNENFWRVWFTTPTCI